MHVCAPPPSPRPQGASILSLLLGSFNLMVISSLIASVLAYKSVAKPSVGRLRCFSCVHIFAAVLLIVGGLVFTVRPPSRLAALARALRVSPPPYAHGPRRSSAPLR